MNAMARCGTRTILRRSAPGRLLLRLQNHQRLLCRRSRELIPLLALLPLLSSCQGPRQSLHVLVVPIARMEWLRDDYRNEQEWEPLRREFRKIHPEVDLQISVGSESKIKEYLSLGRSRGLGPDLLLVQAPVAMALLDRALVQPLPEQPEVRRSLALVEPNDLKRVTGPRGVAGLPMFSEITLACFDRRRLPQAPTSLDELLAVAASGKPIGLAVEPTSLWWTAGAMGAQGALAPIFTGNPRAVGSSEASDRSALETWLMWLRQTTLQSRVDLASGPQDLTVGLESGRLAWIPCYSLTLHRLERTMGAHLGVAPLPSGPGGLPTPSSTLRIWSLGVDSSPRQRRLALSLMELSLNPLVQRQLTLGTKMVLPANRFVPIPVASSGKLAAIEQAQRQFTQTSSLLVTPYSADRVKQVLPTIESVLSQVLVGVMTPRQGSEALMRLYPKR
jgi:ABC-type glycerol-3-phosphate transport system substrate-binding protein